MEAKEKTHYTVQHCTKCGKNVEIEALDFLMNLDEPVVCKECKKNKKTLVKHLTNNSDCDMI